MGRRGKESDALAELMCHDIKTVEAHMKSHDFKTCTKCKNALELELAKNLKRLETLENHKCFVPASCTYCASCIMLSNVRMDIINLNHHLAGEIEYSTMLAHLLG